MHFHAAHRVLVEGVVADREDGGVGVDFWGGGGGGEVLRRGGRGSWLRGRGRRQLPLRRDVQPREAVVHPRLEVGVPVDGEARDGDVGGRDPELDRRGAVSPGCCGNGGEVGMGGRGGSGSERKGLLGVEALLGGE